MRAAQYHRLLRERLKAVREEAGLTQEDLAAEFRRRGWREAEQSRISEIERGGRRTKIEEAVMWAEVCGSDGSFIVDGAGIDGRRVTIVGATARAEARAAPAEISDQISS